MKKILPAFVRKKSIMCESKILKPLSAKTVQYANTFSKRIKNFALGPYLTKHWFLTGPPKAGMANSNCSAGLKIKFISKNFVNGPQTIEYSIFFFVFIIFFQCLLVSIEFSIYFSSYKVKIF